MTPAEQARNQAISLEAKKDRLSQRQSSDWSVTFTIQDADMDPRFTSARMGTRYAMVLVEIGDDELPVAAKETPKPQPAPTAGAKRDWRDLQPAQQAGIRCAEPVFQAYLKETYPEDWRAFEGDASELVRFICGVNSRSMLNTEQAARVIWHQLDTAFQVWKALEHA